MKILIYSPDVFSVFFPETKFIFGGVETEIFLTADELSKTYKENVLVLTRDQGFGPRNYGNVNVLPYPLLKGDGYWSKRQTLSGRIKHKLIGEKSDFKTPEDFFNSINPDVVYVQGLHKHILELARYCKKQGKKFIFKGAHDMDFGGEHNDVKAIEKWANQPLEVLKELYSLADVMLVQTPFQQKILKERFGRDAELILNPIPLGEQPDTAEKKYDVFWVGKTNLFKRPELLATIASKLPQLSFCMVCNKFDEQQFDALKKILPSNVTLIESIPANEIGGLFAISRVFLSTSIHEGFANTFLQASKCGVPIISMCSNPNNMLTEGGAGMLVGDDVATCVQAITGLLNDNAHYEKASQSAFSYVKKNHDIKVILKRVHEVIVDANNSNRS